MTPATIGLILGGISLLGQLFGGSNTAQQTTTTTEKPRGYQSSMLPFMDPMIASLLMGLSKDYNGAGMPGGVSNNQAGMGNMTQMMNMISGGLGKSIGKSSAFDLHG
jgi:hypothetical protein